MTEQTPRDYVARLYKIFDATDIVDCVTDPVDITKMIVGYVLDELISECEYSTDFYEKALVELVSYYP